MIFEIGLRATDGQVFGLRHGLTLFFVLSGFLLFRPFASGMITGEPKPPTGRFYFNRVIRIYPAYIVVLLLVSYVFQVGVNHASNGSSFGMLDPQTLLTNLLLIQSFIPDTFHTGLTVSWSITVELTFYAVLPALAILGAFVATRTNRLLGTLTPPALLLAVGLVGKAWVISQTARMTPDDKEAFFWGANWDGVLSHSIFAHADLFAFGMLAAIIMVSGEHDRINSTTLRQLKIGLVGCFLVTFVLGFSGAPGSYGDTLIAVACSAVVLLVVLPRGRVTGVLVGVLENPFVKYLGQISYSVYLWHLPIIMWLLLHFMTPDATPVALLIDALIVCALTTALAAATYHLVERNALRLKKRTDVGARGLRSITNRTQWPRARK